MKDRFHALDILSLGSFAVTPPMPTKRLRPARVKRRWLSALTKGLAARRMQKLQASHVR